MLCKFIRARCDLDKRVRTQRRVGRWLRLNFFAKQKCVTKLLEQKAGTNDLRYLVQWGIRDNNEYMIPQHFEFLMISEKLWGKMRNNDKQ